MITPLEGKREAVQVVPTWADVQAALEASHQAFEKYDADKKAGRDATDSFAEYMSAINHAACVGADNFYGNLMEAHDELAVHPVI